MHVRKLVWLGRVCLLASGFFAFAAGGASHAAEIGISWPGKSASILVWEKAFKDRLAVIAPEIKVESVKEVPTTEEFGAILKRFDEEKDAIVLFRSNSAEYVKSNPTRKPTFFGSVNNVAELDIIKNPEKPEANYTAASYFLAPEMQLQSFITLTPKLKRLAFVQEAGQASSAAEAGPSLEACRKLGLACQLIAISAPDQIASAIQAKLPEIDGLVIGRQALIIDNAKAVIAAAGEKPVFTYHEKAVKDGALVGMTASNEKLGAQLADAVAGVLLKGRKIQDTPVMVDTAPVLYINMNSAQKLGIQVPVELLGSANLIQ
jgi:putative tryptophan/tyrosine transport system substrate-binding protein